MAINDNAQVAGWNWFYTQKKVGYRYSLYDEVTYDPDAENGITPPVATNGYGINNLGHVVGYKEESQSPYSPEAFRWIDGDSDGVWESNEVTMLGTLGTASTHVSEAWDINDYGIIVGGSDTNGTDGQGNPIQRGFRWNNGTMVALGTLGGYRSWAHAIDEHTGTNEEIVGMADTDLNSRFHGVFHACIWNNNTQPVDLGVLVDDGISDNLALSMAWDVNSYGHSVGYSEASQYALIGDREFDWRGFFHDGTDMESLVPLSGYERSAAYGINESDQVVGSSFQVVGSGPFYGGIGAPFTDPVGTDDAHACLWEEDQGVWTVQDLNDSSLVGAASNWVLHNGMGINESGEITGWGSFDFGGVQNEICGFILTSYAMGDMNFDGVCNGLDIPGFTTALSDADAWQASTGLDPHTIADFNGDGVLNGLDLPAFKDEISGAAVPEPSTLFLLGIVTLFIRRRH